MNLEYKNPASHAIGLRNRNKLHIPKAGTRTSLRSATVNGRPWCTLNRKGGEKVRAAGLHQSAHGKTQLAAGWGDGVWLLMYRVFNLHVDDSKCFMLMDPKQRYEINPSDQWYTWALEAVSFREDMPAGNPKKKWTSIFRYILMGTFAGPLLFTTVDNSSSKGVSFYLSKPLCIKRSFLEGICSKPSSSLNIAIKNKDQNRHFVLLRL